MLETERKFLINNTDFLSQLTGERITQGYLSKDPERTVRIRIIGVKAYITIKGKSNTSGLTRFEWEKELSIIDAEELLELALPGIIDKTRYTTTIGQHLWEIDVFHGLNNGLVVAEIELENEHTSFAKPDWIDREVTGDLRYYNSYLTSCPYTQW